MRDLLFLAHRMPFPPDKGDKIRSFHILKHLSSHFRIHLGCFDDASPDPAAASALQALCADVFCPSLRAAKKMQRTFRAFIDSKAISEAIYFEPTMVEWVAGKMNTLPIKDAFIFCSAMFPYIAPYVRQTRVVLDVVDVDSEKWGSYSDAARWPLSAIYRREQTKVLELERAGVKAADTSLFVSAAEADCFAKIAPDLRTRTDHLENGVDLERFCSETAYPSPFPAYSAAIVFTGMMDYRPNVDAVEWFARKVLPRIRAGHSNAEFWIVGASPVRRVSRLAADHGVRVTGYVPDVRPYLANATCIVAPLQIARGVQNKVLEAMAMGKPIVVSPAALEGISAVPGQDILVAEDAAAFADTVVSILVGQRKTIGQSARRHAEEAYGWARTFAKLDRIMSIKPSAAPGERSAELCAEERARA
jgi:sugar transferase (PEP-CTERM/EpsH1 system associated)